MNELFDPLIWGSIRMILTPKIVIKFMQSTPGACRQSGKTVNKYLKKKNLMRDVGMAQVVEHLPGKYEVQSLKPVPIKNYDECFKSRILCYGNIDGRLP
jgi:hypothetical protein